MLELPYQIYFREESMATDVEPETIDHGVLFQHDDRLVLYQLMGSCQARGPSANHDDRVVRTHVDCPAAPGRWRFMVHPSRSGRSDPARARRDGCAAAARDFQAARTSEFEGRRRAPHPAR